MSEYINDVFDGLKTISTCSEDLATLSRAFEIVGNETISRDLHNTVNTLQAVEVKIRRAVATEINARAGNST